MSAARDKIIKPLVGRKNLLNVEPIGETFKRFVLPTRGVIYNIQYFDSPQLCISIALALKLLDELETEDPFAIISRLHSTNNCQLLHLVKTKYF